MTSAPRILEIGEHRLMREAYPETTTHWSTAATLADRGPRDRLVTLTALPALARALASSDYDLVVVQPGPFPPWHWQAITRSLFRRSTLRGVMPYFRAFGQQMLRGRVAAPIAVWDWEDSPYIFAHNQFLLDRATLFFKRELPVDGWRVFMRTVHERLPTPRFRMLEKQRRRVAKLRPISLGLPCGREALPTAKPVTADQKTADVFFAGRVAGSSTVRERGLAELLLLRDKGVRIDIPDKPLPLDQYLARIARAWLTWSPEGFGYDCFRTYEAAVCGSVPILNRQTVERYKPLRDGEHCLYYDIEPGNLTEAIMRALQDRNRLNRMAIDARKFVLAEHAPAALARYVAETTLSALK
jgi:glycosyltransferase involved in cell wall biosynthesis